MTIKIINKIMDLLLIPIVHIVKTIIMRNYYCHGDSKRLHLGKNISAVNTIFNVSSGNIYIGDDTIFGHNCMLLTGRHDFEGGMRKKLFRGGGTEAPSEGYDINIGKGCWIASGAIIIGGVTIGDNVIVCAGAVVTKNIGNNLVVGGIPAKIIKSTSDID